jgi:site-specific recombinase XerD
MKTIIAVLFVGKRARTTRHKQIPIYLRVTIDKKRFEVATHRHVEPSLWSPSAGRVKGKSDTALETNMALDIITKKVYDYRDQLYKENRDFTVDSLREKWFGQDRNKRTLLGLFRSRIMDFEKLIEKGIYQKSTVIKYKSTEKHLLGYLQWQNAGHNVLLVDLRIGFASNFEYYLQAEKGLSINSCGKMLKNLKKVIRDCVDKDWLDKDPFSRYKVRHIDPKIPHLSADELKALEEKEIAIERLAVVRDVFVFSCYTGFAYVDVASLTTDHIKVGDDGKKWLIKPRQKTGIPEIVPIFPPALRILNKYADSSKVSTNKKLLPVPTNQKVNAYLKELADICGIETKITFHIARHTFASTVTLDNGIPIDSVSKMLGHRSIKTTQIYAKVSNKKISDDTKELFQKLQNTL